MGAPEITLSDNIEAELNPHVVIMANDLERFAAFAALLEKNGFPCRVDYDLQKGTPRPGTIFFISFNLKSADVGSSVKHLEQLLRMNCIVFAEEEGVQTATKLAAAKMTQTLQHPYTEKNFLMAVQTIVKNRKEQHAKDVRKKQHEDRQRSKQKMETIKPTDPGLIIQKAAELMDGDSKTVFKGERHEQMTLLQKANKGETFFAIQEGPSSARGSSAAFTYSGNSENRSPGNPIEKSKTIRPTLTLQIERNDPIDTSLGSSAEAKVPPPTAAPKSPETLRFPSKSPKREWTMSEVWAIVLSCLIGSLICLYCVYQILFGK